MRDAQASARSTVRPPMEMQTWPSRALIFCRSVLPHQACTFSVATEARLQSYEIRETTGAEAQAGELQLSSRQGMEQYQSTMEAYTRGGGHSFSRSLPAVAYTEEGTAYWAD
jgi:hypothetical protein